MIAFLIGSGIHGWKLALAQATDDPYQVADHINVGPISRDWGLDKQLVNGNKFEPIKEFDNYMVYERVRK